MSLPATKRQIAELLPEQGCWDEEAYLGLTDGTNRLVELVDGRLEMLPPPTERHQLVLGSLLDRFRAAAPGGIVLFAPFRIRIAPGHIREPDLVVLFDRDDPRREDRHWHGADVVVEVVSPSNRKHDVVTKHREYARAGIAEYWIVDPEREEIVVLYLESGAGRYDEHGRFGPGDAATSHLIPGLRIDVSELFDTV